MLQSMGSQIVGHDWATELNWTKTFLWEHLGKCFQFSLNKHVPREELNGLPLDVVCSPSHKPSSRDRKSSSMQSWVSSGSLPTSVSWVKTFHPSLDSPATWSINTMKFLNYIFRCVLDRGASSHSLLHSPPSPSPSINHYEIIPREKSDWNIKPPFDQENTFAARHTTCFIAWRKERKAKTRQKDLKRSQSS